MRVNTYTVELQGTSYEIGRQQAQALLQAPGALSHHKSQKGLPRFTADDTREAQALLNRWCPGLTEELASFGDTAGIPQTDLTFYAMSCLRPRCSQLALAPHRMAGGAPLLARNYDFNPSAEDFALVRTSVRGKYTHLGTSTMTFGRDEGMNEHGLCVAMSSCGLPVGAAEYMQPPTTKGLIFWVVLRALLENCRTVAEAQDMLADMPIAFNLNMIVMDKTGAAVLVQVVDGQKALLPMGPDGVLCATNHATIPPLVQEVAMRNSVQRMEAMHRLTQDGTVLDEDSVKNFLLAPVPRGLFNPYYEDFLGTTKSVIMRPQNGTMDICWAGLAQNGWQRYAVSSPWENTMRTAELQGKRAARADFEFVPV